MRQPSERGTFGQRIGNHAIALQPVQKIYERATHGSAVTILRFAQNPSFPRLLCKVRVSIPKSGANFCVVYIVNPLTFRLE
jgi:hypothetical protein